MLFCFKPERMDCSSHRLQQSPLTHSTKCHSISVGIYSDNDMYIHIHVNKYIIYLSIYLSMYIQKPYT